MDDLGMEPTEALVDGSLNCSQNRQIEDELVDLLVKFTELCNSKGSGNAAIASRNGDLQSREAFRTSGGPSILVGILTDGFENIDILSNGFAIVVAAATSNEVIKELFMELMKIDELILRVLSVKREVSTESLYDAIQVLLTHDDNRVLASQVYGYAQKFAKIEIVGALVESIRVGLSSSSLVSASIALKDVAVNLAGSDANKNAIVENKGMDRLINCHLGFITTLLSPSISVVAIEAGAGELALQAMQKFLAAQQICIERHIKMAKQNHVSCREAATDALRDLGLDDYNV
ncbi:armadillo repeat-containing protein 6 [Pyrus ussuriensis x Pyrus communis]|uniref:Armadillo repeat-containing protein 6 n=1 Tax=Pyrus ussuriensis x Pyrus communis TaxID=2448454 RepID=A0A5N5IDJ0_9ROSA|nr:armadillo repeat-containing protein 6 [Pyrus ussuriensis x Pyrus communis]